MFGKSGEIKAQLNLAIQELLACEAKVRDLLTKNRIGILVVDCNGAIRFANSAAVAIFECTEEELLGKRFASPVAVNANREVNLKSRSGRTVTVETWEIETDWEGTRAYFVFLHDVTEREQKAQELRKLYRAITESPSMVMITDAQGIVEYVNPKFAEVTGYTSAEIVGKDFRLLRSDAVPAAVYGEMRESMSRGGGWHGELSARRMNGDTFLASVSISPVKDFEGHIANFIAVMEDITERKRMEDALRESRDRAQAIITSALDAVVEIDETGTIISWNPRAAEIFGWSAEEAVGRQPNDIIIPGQYREAHLKGLKHFLSTGEGPILNRHMELSALHRDGREFPIELTVVPIRAGGGYTFTAFVRDITENKRAMEALRFSESRYRALYRDNPTMIATLDADLTMLSVNPFCASQLGYMIDELEGQPVLKLFHEDDRSAVAEQLRMCLHNPDQVYRWRFRKVRKDGGLLWVEELARAVYDLNGALNILVVCRDITAHKLAEEEIEKLNTDLAARAAELESANTELEAFNYTVAHDLRKPLTIINGYCQALQESCGALDEQCRGYLRETYDGTLRMNRLIDALLDFSSLAHREIRPETVDLSAMAGNIAAELSVAEGKRRVAFAIAGGVTAVGDPALLRVALENLLGNAWKYTGNREEAVIEFGAAEVGGKPVCFVRDNGAGFDMADAEKLFIPFQRLHGADKFKGHGIGLATAERIIRRHGGRIWAEGEPGKGATFWFTLPGHQVDRLKGED